MKPLIVRKNSNSCIIRWNYDNDSYSLTWGKYSDPSDRAKLELAGKLIYQDCLTNNFDTSLNKYKCWLLGIVPDVNSYSKVKCPSLITLLEERLENLYSSADQSVLNLLKQYKISVDNPCKAKDFLKWIQNRGVATSTQKRYLAVLQVVRKDLFGHLKVKLEGKPRPRPLTIEQVHRFIAELERSPNYCHYVDFFLFLFNSGLRINEAIGLRWQDVDLDNREIQVYQSLIRNRGKISTRIRKTTKTSKHRVVPINNKVCDILTNRKSKDSKGSDLIFLSHKGKPIDDHTLSQRCWRITLEKSDIPHRPMRVTRSTFVSHCAASGMEPANIAQITGHDVKILYENYLGAINKPILPEL
ncbi:MAG: site-specific integrase [Myxacorys californica WJT36-NPBG1]|jgi:integrase|nr:site-specific integrase [Myxacorys californica WJT36-NPBG1]